MDKRPILEQIVNYLKEELATLMAAAKEAREYATDAETRAEDKYDTRATESSYLADGQGRLAAEVKASLETYQSLELRDFGPGQQIALTALVEVEQGGFRDLYFLGPRAGGLTVSHDGREVYVLTAQSPIGAKLLGQVEGGRIAIAAGREGAIVRVV
ncbi:MAG: transcription elongation factor GreAB [Opitutaceae bacterium]